jgi:hypothetical protein
MTDYQLYILDHDGSIRKHESLELSDDNNAFAYALARTIEGAVEVWSGSRKVCFIDQNSERRTGTR